MRRSRVKTVNCPSDLFVLLKSDKRKEKKDKRWGSLNSLLVALFVCTVISGHRNDTLKLFGGHFFENEL
jgi:hypothetical protein